MWNFDSMCSNLKWHNLFISMPSFVMCYQSVLVSKSTLHAASSAYVARINVLGGVLTVWTFHLLAVLCTDEASDGAEIVEVCAMQHPEQRLLCPAPLDYTARLLLPVIIPCTQLGGSRAPRIPLCHPHAHTEKHLSITFVSYFLNLHTYSCTHTHTFPLLGLGKKFSTALQ